MLDALVAREIRSVSASRAAAGPAMFTSQSLRAVVKPGSVHFGEHRLDDVVHQIDVRGTLDDNAGRERVESALAGGVRWLILDLGEALDVADGVLAALVSAAAALRMRKGELIVAGASRSVSERLGAYDVAYRPALAANVDQAVMILKMLRPKTDIRRPPQRAKQRISSLTLPRIEPPATA
jgi:anti-anti-sigma regulatory factor